MNEFNKNNHKIIIIDFKTYIQKKYDDLDRFNCEMKHLKIFKQRKFLVPSIYETNQKNSIITLDFIEGNVYEKLDGKKVKNCIDILVKIISVFGLEKNNNIEISKYITRVKENILRFCIQNNLRYSEYDLKNNLEKLESLCFISLFKDAKPSNWIFQKNKVYMVDFDYVKKSFFMADLAQLLSYTNLKYTAYIKYFLKKLFPSNSRFDKFYNPFLIAVVNSNIASVLHNKKLSYDIKKDFDKTNKNILKQLSIIK